MQCIPLELTVKGFKKCCISSGVDGTDDMLWNGSDDRECYKCDEDTDCGNGDSDTDW